jgi:hypothetical protein
MGVELSVLSSWKLETSRTDQVSSVLSSISATTGTPMLPPTSVGRPAASRISPSSVVVVVLPLEPVMASILALEEARGQFQLADDRQAEALHLRQLGRVQRHAGADDDQVLAAEGEQAVAAGLDHDALFEQRGNLLGQRLGAAHVGDRDLRAAAAQKQRRRQTGFSQSDDQNFFAFEFHHQESIVLRLPRPLLLCTAGQEPRV